MHRRVYTDATIFDAEMERIYNHVWLFVAHESQLSEPGQFVTAYIGNRPMIVSRHTDGEIHVFANRCTIAHEDLARQSENVSFVLITDGPSRPTAVNRHPTRRGYNGNIDPKIPLALDRAARVDIYRGFILNQGAWISLIGISDRYEPSTIC